MRAGEFDHSFRKGRAPEISVEAAAHLRSTSQLAPEIFAPTSFIIERPSCKITFSEKLRRAQRVIDAFARHGVCEARRITEQRPAFTASAPCIPSLHCQARNARSITLGSSFKTIFY